MSRHMSNFNYYSNLANNTKVANLCGKHTPILNMITRLFYSNTVHLYEYNYQYEMFL